jgi:hypothetical protein
MRLRANGYGSDGPQGEATAGPARAYEPDAVWGRGLDEDELAGSWTRETAGQANRWPVPFLP